MLDTSTYTPVNVEFVDHSTVELYKHNLSDLDIARAAWVSQDADAALKEKEPGRVEGLINFLVRNGHTSPLEHGSATFIINTPIFVSREIVRHRTFSYNEISGRYTELPLKFYKPDADRPLVQSGKVGAYTFSPGHYGQVQFVESTFRTSIQRSAEAYQKMLDVGVAKEVARDVLPVSTMTTLFMTGNLLNWFKFLKLRTAPDALYEIREVAGAIEEEISKAVPLAYKAYKEYM